MDIDIQQKANLERRLQMMRTEFAENNFQIDWTSVYESDIDLLKEHVMYKKEYELYKSKCQIARKRMIKTWVKLSKKYQQKILNPGLIPEEELGDIDRLSQILQQDNQQDQRSHQEQQEWKTWEMLKTI